MRPLAKERMDADGGLVLRNDSVHAPSEQATKTTLPTRVVEGNRAMRNAFRHGLLKNQCALVSQFWRLRGVSFPQPAKSFLSFLMLIQ